MKIFKPIICFFYEKVWLFQIKAVPLHHQNPPSLSTMLKCAGRFMFMQMSNRIPFQKPAKKGKHHYRHEALCGVFSSGATEEELLEDYLQKYQL